MNDKKQRLYMVKHWLIGQLINLPCLVFCLLWILTYLAFTPSMYETFSAHSFRGWMHSLELTWSLLVIIVLSQVVGWSYWLLRLHFSKIPGLAKRALIWIGIVVGLTGIILFSTFLDFAEINNKVVPPIPRWTAIERRVLWYSI